jgi:hypothetical protein
LDFRGRAELEALIDEMALSGVALGNSPYQQLRNEHVEMNYVGSDGCLRQKPKLRRYVGYIRATAYYPFDPVSFFYEDPGALTPRVKAFLGRYAVRQAQYTSNAVEERTTLPSTSQRSKILVIGDSVAAGAMVADAETIASHLQRLRPGQQVVNAGINGADANAIICAAERAAGRYPGQISALVYFWSENDFDGAAPLSEPNAAMQRLQAFVERNRIARTVIVYCPYVYNTVPEITRIPKLSSDRATYLRQSHALRQAVTEKGLAFLSIADLADEVRKQSGSQFGPLALYVDHAHLSDFGGSVAARAIAQHLPQ